MTCKIRFWIVENRVIHCHVTTIKIMNFDCYYNGKFGFQQFKNRILQVIHSLGGANKQSILLSKTARNSKFLLATIAFNCCKDKHFELRVVLDNNVLRLFAPPRRYPP
jgi:hypothetical protein